MPFGAKKLTGSVATKIAIIAIGPLLGLALTLGVSLYTQKLRNDSEATITMLRAQRNQVDAFENKMAVSTARLSGFLESRSQEVAESLRKDIAEAGKVLENLRQVEAPAFREGRANLEQYIAKIKTAFEKLDGKVAVVGRTSQSGLTEALDRDTEIAMGLFEGAASMDDRFRPLMTAFVEFRGTELRYRWLRDPKMENRVDFMRNALTTRITRTDWDRPQADLLHDAVERQGSAFAAWKKGVQEESNLRNAAVELVIDARRRAAKLGEKVEQMLMAEREHSAGVSALAGRLVMIAVALSCVISVALIVLVGRGLSRALVDLSQVMTSVAAGETEVSIPSLRRRDEIGVMAQALGVFQSSIAERAALASQSEREQQERLARAQRIEAKISAFDAVITASLGTLRSSAGAMDSVSAALDHNSQVLAEHSGIAGRATASASGEVNAVAASTSQLTASVEEVSRQAVRSTEVANQAVAQSRRASEMMSGLMVEAARIGDVVALIRSVTKQTNLLALNATIEAARAGETGKGFAVVASEVKALASQTAHATEEIAAKIGGIQSASSNAGEAIDAIDSILGEMSAIAASVAAAVDEQSSAIGSIADNVNVAAANVREGADAIREAEERARAGRSTAAEVGRAAKSVAEGSKEIEVQISQFLQDVRAQ